MRRMLIAGVVAGGILLAACGGGDDGGGPEPVAGEAGAFDEGATTVEREEADQGGVLDARAGSAAGADRDGPAAAPPVPGAPQDAAAASLQEVVPVGAQRLIRDAEVRAVVDDLDRAVADLTALARRLGGFVAGAELLEDGGRFVIRVPSGDLEAALAAIGDIAREVPETRISVQDVGGEHADLEARLRNLRAFERELLSLLADVRQQDGGADELLAVFERIRGVREEIERIEARLDTLDDRVALSTVTVQLDVPAVVASANEPPPAWHPGEVAAAAGRTTLRALQTLVTAVIWIGVVAVPVAAAVAAPFAVAWGGRRWLRRRASTPA